jgi:hypothetical protein
MARVGTAEFRERAEEMVVAGLAFGSDEAAHGEGVDQPIVEPLVLQDRSGGDRTLAAGRCALACDLPLVEGMRRHVDAELVLDGVLDQRLREHGAMQMKVQLAALRHALEEFVKGKRIAANLIERLGGAKLGLARFRPGNRRHRRGRGSKQEGRSNDDAGATHGASHSTKSGASVPATTGR